MVRFQKQIILLKKTKKYVIKEIELHAQNVSNPNQHNWGDLRDRPLNEHENLQFDSEHERGQLQEN